jgi:hypothetical protein
LHIIIDEKFVTEKLLTDLDPNAPSCLAVRIALSSDPEIITFIRLIVWNKLSIEYAYLLTINKFGP